MTSVLLTVLYLVGDRGGTVVKVLCYKSEGRWFDPRWCHWNFSLTSHYGLGSTQPLTEMSTRRISWGKGGRYVRLTNLPYPCAVVMKSGNLNFLEPSGPLQACNRTALPLLYLVITNKQNRKQYNLYIRGLSGKYPPILNISRTGRVAVM